MRSRAPLFALLFAVGSFALPLAAHAGIPFFGPVIPQVGNQATCAGSFGMLITVINNLISLLLTLAIVFVAPLMIAYSGFLFVLNPTDPSGISKGKSILWHTVFGIVIALCGWLIVDAIMAVLYNPAAVGQTWSSLIGSQGQPLCINLQASLNQAAPQNNIGVSTGGTLATTGTGACNASTVQAAAQAGGYNISATQANVLACIAQPESTCGRNTSVAHQPDGTPTTATGAFQITFGAGTDQCHQLNLPVCSQAVNWNGNLNCSSVFTCSLSNPSACQPKPGKEANATACTAAAMNLNCNASAAACLLALPGGANYHDWVADPRASAQGQCVTNNGG